MCVCINKKNKYEFIVFIHWRLSQNKNTDSNLFHCILFNYIKIKKYACKNKIKYSKFIGLFTDARVRNKDTDVNLFYFIIFYFYLVT